MKACIKTILLCVAFAASCGVPVDDQPPSPVVQSSYELPQPALRSVAPSAISVGSDLSIMGEGFPSADKGEVHLLFQGVYQTTSGKTNQVDLRVTGTQVNQGVVTWNFGPNIPFTTEEETGTFRGIVRVMNMGKDGTAKQAQQALSVELQVLPSIIIRQMRPLAAGCGVGITDTSENQEFFFELKAIGLRDGTTVAPTRFAYTFMKENFQFSGYLSDNLGMDPEALFPKTGPVSVIDYVSNGSVSTLGAGSPHKVEVVAGVNPQLGTTLSQATDSLFELVSLKTAPVTYGENYEARMTVVATDSTGQTAERVIPLKVWVPVEVKRLGVPRIVRSYDPEPVTGCLPGGDIGRDVSYTEAKEETRTRSFTVSGNVGGGFDIQVARLNASFGFEVNSEVSSKQYQDLKITGFLIPGEYGAFYRQTLQLEHKASLVSHGPCGHTQAMGDVVVTDWIWSPDLGKGKTCPPLPASNLPPGQIF
jgi:hypothetical protein